MKMKRFCILLIAASLAVSALAGCSKSGKDSTDRTTKEEMEQNEWDSEVAGDAVAFRPVDCGVQAQAVYEYPFIGLTAKLTQTMLDRIDSRDVFVAVQDGYVDATTIEYAMMRFSATTEEQKQEEGTSIDYFGWEASLEKIGVLGVYQKGQSDRLDELTGCDSHEKIGQSTDGAYEYYLSVNTKGNQDLIADLKKTEVTVGQMRALDPNYNYTAFSTGRTDDVATVGEFTTEDVLGNSYTQDLFKEYDLTLVNAFTTWCSPCVEEMPILEELRQAFAKKGISFQVVGVVIDTKNGTAIDEGAMERAQALYKKSGIGFPLLVPDDNNMNDRLKGLESFPESFFVDRNGNIVGETYMGAHSLAEWTEIVNQELSNLGGTNS